MEIYKEQSFDKPPILTTSVALLLKANPEHYLAKDYLKKVSEYQEKQKSVLNGLKTPKKNIVSLPELKPIDVEDLYRVFKEAFHFFNDKEFNEMLNKNNGFQYGETGILARTLCAYFIKSKSFFRSPLLNFSKNKPSLEKGIAIFGSFGLGKTAQIETFQKMFKYNDKPIAVLDIEGSQQILQRYQLGFNYFTANKVLEDYKGISLSDKKKEIEYTWEIFWKKHSWNFNYYDDLMTERTLKDFGETVELFKDIFEKRYANKAKTMISLNYYGDGLDSTLNQFGEKYGNRVYDRFFELFNIIELNGKSLRQ